MSRSQEGSDEVQLRSVMLPGPVALRTEPTTQTPVAARSVLMPPAAEAPAPAMLDDFRDRPTIPLCG
jgi:hypothetical protein